MLEKELELEKKSSNTSQDSGDNNNNNVTLCQSAFHKSENSIHTKCQVECSRRFSVQACNVLNELRSKNQLCDAKIKVDNGTEFLVHRAILSASSRYFHALFTNGMNITLHKTIHIKEIDSEVMKHLIGM
jgi:hypothetical protein